jgi:hypothetical protein
VVVGAANTEETRLAAARMEKTVLIFAIDVC